VESSEKAFMGLSGDSEVEDATVETSLIMLFEREPEDGDFVGHFFIIIISRPPMPKPPRFVEDGEWIALKGSKFEFGGDVVVVDDGGVV